MRVKFLAFCREFMAGLGVVVVIIALALAILGAVAVTIFSAMMR